MGERIHEWVGLNLVNIMIVRKSIDIYKVQISYDSIFPQSLLTGISILL